MREFPSPDYVFLGVGSDETLDLFMRLCVVPGCEKILSLHPLMGCTRCARKFMMLL